MVTLYPRGSEWRRWDLHVHAPGTALADNFADNWDGYIKAIENADQSLAVVGITDYASINTYKKVKAFRDTNRLTNVAMVLPNIEFRISPETKYGKGINLHILISPDDPDHIERIDEALARLRIVRDEEDIACTQAGLTRLGKLTKPALQSSPEAAYKEGVNQFKVDFEHFRTWYANEQWLSKNALIAIDAGSKDGASGLQEGGYKATRREIYAFADLVFSGNMSEREAWLGRGTIPQEEFQILGVPKAVVHGSDAHDIAKLFQPDQKKYCWIKADPTFEGLRQVLYEPEDRVWIGEVPPTTHEAQSLLDSIVLNETNGWFDDNREVPLNNGMVAIIGLKGSGKTALADLIAFAGGARLDDENSFVSRAHEHINGLGVLLQWKDGAPDLATVPDVPGGASGLTVRYLSQKFVDRLCSGDTLSEELQREIESVIFQHLDPDDQMDCEGFDELRQFRTEGIHETRADVQVDIQARSQEISDLDDRRAAVLAKTARRNELPKLISNLEKTLPKIDDQATTAKIAELEKLRARLLKVTKTLGTAKQSKQLIQDIERRLSSKVQEVETFWAGIASALTQLGFSDAEISKLAPSWNKHPEVFKARYSKIEAEIKVDEGTSGSPSSDSVAAIQNAIAKAEAELKLDKAKKEKVITIGKERQRLLEEKRKLDAEFTWVEKAYKAERQQASQQRTKSYLSFFDLLQEERSVLEDLYGPLRTSLESQGSHEKKLGLVCRVEVDTENWISKGAELFDLRKTGTFRYDEVEAIAKTELHPAWRSCDKEKIQAALEKCVALIKEASVLKGQLKTGFHPRDVASWLFDVEHIEVSHGVQYEGKELRLLSPGTKGIVLLILYLAVDRFDRRPLIVDQPDENLDNQSTYEILRGFFREAKKRRQIIVITHNPNLVVNTDAEQVIVAESILRSDGLPYIRYSSGSLESAAADGPLAGTIREAVCRIMEGGKDAFRNRESRYGRVLDN